MSILGLLVVTSPEFIHATCRGWPGRGQVGDNCVLPPDLAFEGPSVSEVYAALERALPFSVDIKLRGAMFEQKVLYVGYERDPDGRVVDGRFPKPLFEWDEAFASDVLAKVDAWRPYSNSASRRAAGLGVFCFADDF